MSGYVTFFLEFFLWKRLWVRERMPLSLQQRLRDANHLDRCYSPINLCTLQKRRLNVLYAYHVIITWSQMPTIWSPIYACMQNWARLDAMARVAVLVEFNYEELEVSQLIFQSSCTNLFNAYAGVVPSAPIQRGRDEHIHCWARGGQSLCLKERLPSEGRQEHRQCHYTGIYWALPFYRHTPPIEER